VHFTFHTFFSSGRFPSISTLKAKFFVFTVMKVPTFSNCLYPMWRVDFS